MPVIRPLAGSFDGPKQYSQPSRKGKKAWRKHVDVSEVEEGLERLKEEIISGGVLADRESDDLFVLDVKGDAAVSKRIAKHGGKKLKADEIIAQRSAVPAVSLRKRPADTPSGIIVPKRQRTDYVSHKELTRLRKVADGHHESTVAVTDASYDVWDAPEESSTTLTASTYDFLPEPAATKAPKTLYRNPISLAANGRAIPAVQQPKGGLSYNPLFADYEQRYTEESNKAVSTERARLEAAEAEQQKLEAAARSAAEADAAEARAELSEWDEDESAWEGIDSGADEAAAIRAKRPKRKTPSQRNRINRRKEAEREERHRVAMNLERKKEAELEGRDGLSTAPLPEDERIKPADFSDEKLRMRKAVVQHVEPMLDTTLADEDGDDDKLRRKPLGGVVVPGKYLELVLPDELKDSLRLLRPEGDLMRDRYRSLLVRGKLESRRRIAFRKQAKKKATEKWTHKDFHLDI